MVRNLTTKKPSSVTSRSKKKLKNCGEMQIQLKDDSLNTSNSHTLTEYFSPIKKIQNPPKVLQIASKDDKINKNKAKTSSHTLTEYFPVRRSVRKTKRTVLEEKQKTLEQCIRNETEEGLEIHNFSEKGRGIVTTQPFYKGDFVVEYRGELIDMAEARKREMFYSQDQNTGCYMYYFKHKNVQYCVDATAESGYLGRLVNHSRNGNLVTRTVAVDGIPRLILIAKEDIMVGEEITYDYGDRSKESLKYHPWLAL